MTATKEEERETLIAEMKAVKNSKDIGVKNIIASLTLPAILNGANLLLG